MKSDFTIDVLSAAMSLQLKRHAAIAGNIANADTPGYRPKQVSFEDSLQRAAEGKSIDRLNHVDAKTLTVDDGIPRPDGNSVSMERQMAKLAENTLVYNASAEFLARKLRMMKMAIG